MRLRATYFLESPDVSQCLRRLAHLAETLFGGFLNRWRGAAAPGWQIEQVGGQMVEIGEDFRRRDAIRVFGDRTSLPRGWPRCGRSSLLLPESPDS